MTRTRLLTSDILIHKIPVSCYNHVHFYQVSVYYFLLDSDLVTVHSRWMS